MNCDPRALAEIPPNSRGPDRALPLPPGSVAPGHDEESSALCLACGMCCDGTLHRSGRLVDEDDADRAHALGLAIVQTDGHRGFAMPCARFDRCCTAYGVARPRVCAQYFCEPLLAFRRGDLPLEEARARVEEALELRDRFHRATEPLPGFPGTPTLRRLTRVLGEEGGGLEIDAGTIALAHRLVSALRILSPLPEEVQREAGEEGSAQGEG